MLLGLLNRDDGAIRVLGIDPQREPMKLRSQIGYLAEDQAMYGWMRVDESCDLSRRFIRLGITNWR